MKILYLVNTDPRNTSYGGEQRTHFIWEGLKKVGEVYTVIPVAHAYQEKVDEADRIRWVCFEKRWTPGWLLRRLLARRFPRIGLPCGYDIKKFITRYTFVFDKCVVRYVTMASFLKVWKIAPMILDVDDLLTEAFDSCHDGARTLLQKTHRMLLEQYQSFVFKHAKHLWVTNPLHCQILGQFSVSALPNIPCGLSKSVKDVVSSRCDLLFVGALNCDQNYWGIDYFLERYWPSLSAAFPQISFKIVGGGLPDCYKKKWAGYPKVELLGFVRDVLPLYEDCMCVLAPQYVGSGSAIKVLEALYAGRVCLAPPHAFRGIAVADCRPENGILVFNNESEVVSGLKCVLNPNQRRVMQQGAFSLVCNKFSQKQVDEAVKSTLSK